MESEFERSAKRAAVEAVESRLAHNERIRKRAARKRIVTNLGSLAIGLVVLSGIALWFAHRSGGMPKFGFDARGLAKTAGEWLPDFGAHQNAGFRNARERYASVAAEFAKGELAHWKDAPSALKPKNAPKGTVYHALVPRRGNFELYELTSGGMTVELTPFGKPVPLTTEDFKGLCGGKPYFIACAGRVFVCGGGDLQMMDELRKALLPRDADRRQDAEMR